MGRVLLAPSTAAHRARRDAGEHQRQRGEEEEVPGRAPHQRLQTACRRRMDAPPSQVASVRFQMPFDSDSLGGATALPSRLPEWDRRPRVMVDASTVATIDSMQEHADSLLQAQRIAEGRARAARNRQSGAREEGSSSAAESSSAEEDESKEDESV